MKGAGGGELDSQIPPRALCSYLTCMKIRLLLFAQYRDAAGAGELDLDVPNGASALDAVAVLRARGATFQRIPERPVVAVNQDYSALEQVLQDGDEVALLPPVAGG